ncbi:MAG: NAD(P)-dependent oxidoreductase [Desulfovibrionaceae bacterium]|nr:NAD(P)-dependent oxidoreductase [Desulfovibrionaceae bacterium]
MKILVTGAAGFIGGQLYHKLWQQGNSVVGIDNFSYGNLDNLRFDDIDLSTKIITMDIREQNTILNLFEQNQFDIVYNMAGVAPLPDCQNNPVEAVSVNIGGLVNLLECGRKTGIKHLVQASTNAIYENEVNFPTVEDNFLPPTLIYPNTKYCAERFCQSFCDTYNMNVTCLRFANVYGPHIDCLRKQPPFVGYMIRELYYNHVPEFHSDGNQRRDYIYVDDLINLALKVIHREGFDAVNVSSNSNYSVKELYAIACELMKKDIDANYNPPMRYWKKYPELYQGAYSIKPEILEHEVNKYSLCDNKLAKTKYNWEPEIDIREGLKRVIEAECEMLKNRDLAKGIE